MRGIAWPHPPHAAPALFAGAALLAGTVGISSWQSDDHWRNDAASVPQPRAAINTLPEPTVVPSQATRRPPINHTTKPRVTATQPAFSRNPRLDRTIRQQLGRGLPGARSALQLVGHTRFADPRYAAQLRAEIAQVLFTDGDDTLALQTARNVMAAPRLSARPQSAIGLAGMIAGLAAWREGDIRLAETMFERAADADAADPDTRAGAAFWAARTHIRLGDTPGSHLWLDRAAAFPDTFYGMLAARVARKSGLRPPALRDANPLPMPRLRPERGFVVNPALVYALVRVESNFDPRAVSGAGAHGLMQIMPVTARFVTGGAHDHRSTHAVLRALDNARSNLDIGQTYLDYLARQRTIDGDLIRMLASYNAGPNALGHWSREQGVDAASDPLLFIEALPARETRDFVHRVLRALWSYDARMRLPSPSLDTLAQGGWPVFTTQRKLAD